MLPGPRTALLVALALASAANAQSTTDVIRGHVRFENVEFEYEAGRPVLRGITLEAKPGTVTALVGSSGSGKSTLIGLVAAFSKPQAGRITIDGVDLSTARLDSYRSQLGVVLQDNFLFCKIYYLYSGKHLYYLWHN